MKSPSFNALTHWTAAFVSALLALWLFWFAAAQQIQSLYQLHYSAIQQMLVSDLTGDTKILTRQLSSSFDLPYLKVSQLDGVVLHEQSNTLPTYRLAFWLLDKFDRPIIAASIKDQSHNLQVEFLPALAEQLDRLELLSLYLFFGILVLGILPYYLQPARPKQAKDLPPHPIEEAVHQAPAVVQPLQSQQSSSGTDYLLELALYDQLTSLPNRQQFVRYYEQQVKAANAAYQSIFLVVRCSSLSQINQTKGYLAGDLYIKEMADLLKALPQLSDESPLFRLNNTDFCVWFPQKSTEYTEDLLLLLQQGFQSYRQQKQLDAVALTALVEVAQGKPLAELLAMADAALGLAKAKNSKVAAQSDQWHLLSDMQQVSADSQLSSQDWLRLFDDVVQSQRLSLLAQPIQALNKTTKTYAELVVRFRNSDDQLLPTASFLEMAQKLDKLIEIEQLIVKQALILAAKHPDQSFGVNLSDYSVQTEGFISFLEQRLAKDSDVSSRLVFEISESGLLQNLKLSKKLIDMLHQFGSRITVEKFGAGITSFKFFRELKPDFAKMDASYTRQIEDDKNNQYYVRLMVDLAHRIGVAVFAEHVETAAEQQMLESLLIDGVQGYFFSKPAPLE
ncbi:GGDEF domain-containing protein [Rheinheimera sediminis]|uniref:EAL domain-containing protein n=1 Tax=Rheinheimera sp. YQF-1 TaxID=2499626 RepID=UPI000FD73875|nr:GGDEF domain-containing protein [Rheinheimera sp. YQF-1]RVT46876.1 GGDEF domain-containing protein [Rheinheimera sp. YQF-1]